MTVDRIAGVLACRGTPSVAVLAACGRGTINGPTEATNGPTEAINGRQHQLRGSVLGSGS